MESAQLAGVASAPSSRASAVAKRFFAFVPSAGVILGSKLVGLARESLISALFGTSATVSTFYAVQQIPLILSNFLTGALPLAFIPRYQDVRGRSNHEANTLVSRTLAGALMGALLVATVLCALSPSLIARLWSFDGRTSAAASAAARWMSLAAPAIAVVGVTHAVLHAERRHATGLLLFAAPTAVMTCVLASMHFGLVSATSPLAFAYAIGWALAMLLAIRLQRTTSGRPHWSTLTGAPAAPQYRRQLFAAGGENAVFNVNQLMLTHALALTGASSVAVASFGQRIALLPISMLVGPVGHFLAARVGPAPGVQLRRRVVLFTVIAAALAAGGLFVVRHFLVRLLLERGAFTASDTEAVARAMVPLCMQLFATANMQLLARLLFAQGEGRLYSRMASTSYILAIVLRYALVGAGVEAVLWCGALTDLVCAMLVVHRCTRAH